jgi:hypothetical protein
MERRKMLPLEELELRPQSQMLSQPSVILAHIILTQWRAVHGSKGSIASVVKKRKEKN